LPNAAISEAAQRQTASSGLLFQWGGSFDYWKHQQLQLESATNKRQQRIDKAKWLSINRGAMQENYLPTPPVFDTESESNYAWQRDHNALGSER
jgi:hypothetical protein